jgi:hypothetical protein
MIGSRMGRFASSLRGLIAEFWDQILFVICAVVVAYTIGFATAAFELPPYGTVAEGWGATRDWQENWRSNLGIEPTKHLSPARNEGSGVTRHVEDKVQPGITLLESLFEEGVGLRLVDMEGNIVQTWLASFSQIEPDPQLINMEFLPTNDFEVFIQGSALYPEGDVLFNFGGLTLVRMTMCGDVEWTLPMGIHHSIHIAEDGNIWTLGRRFYHQPNSDFPGIPPRFRDDLILEVSPDGEILHEISLLRILFENDLAGVLYPLEGDTMDDLLHANDVEILSSEDAPAFPLFEAGDAMVSLRRPDMVLVFDPETGEVKWWQTGPWVLQHDPDFLPDGRISVFDNRDDGAGGRVLGGSRLLVVDPVTREIEVIYQGTEANPFFTAERGKADPLQNGNFLITETQFGRVFEITPDGEIVWEFINRYDETRVANVNGATRYPGSFGQFDPGRCSGQAVSALRTDRRD